MTIGNHHAVVNTFTIVIHIPDIKLMFFLEKHLCRELSLCYLLMQLFSVNLYIIFYVYYAFLYVFFKSWSVNVYLRKIFSTVFQIRSFEKAK